MKKMIEYKIIFRETTKDGDEIYHFEIEPKYLILFGYLLESLEGWAYYTTIDSKKSIFLVEVIKDYKTDFENLLEKINNY